MKFKNVIATCLIAATLFGATNPTHAQTKHFNDVPQNHWSFTAIHDLKEKQILSGYGNGIFGFGDDVTREQVAILMYNYLKPDNREGFTNPYSDINSLTTHYSKEILSLTNLGIFTGDEHGNFRPKDTLTRAEMASVLTKAFQLKATGAFTFKDILNGYWAKDAIHAIHSNHIAEGTGNNNYSPYMNVSREQYAQFIFNAMNRNNEPDNNNFPLIPVEEIEEIGESHVTNGGTIFKG
ncbi:S-layer homology domain-containing protein [Bacillus dicomae]|uniref:S-layer homology domain-containing protein n=1 Tax=Bacillus dicomae TaxID=3088378 RepID=A0AC61TCT2_9BACI|nr:S-layer homology domain-containing protein [Bacillus dicomae]TPV47300.1 S-layer homology domain-containing protein [Bacillus dicomae]